MARYSAWLVGRFLFALLLCTVGLAGVLLFAAIGEIDRVAALPLMDLLRFAFAVGVMGLPFSLFAALVWLSLEVSERGILDFLETCGVSKRRYVIVVCFVSLLVLLAGALVHEITIPRTRDVLAPGLFIESRSRHPMLTRYQGNSLMMVLGPRLSRLQQVWAWDDAGLLHFEDLEFHDGAWWQREQGTVSLALPQPAQLLALRPFLLELLSVWELVPIVRTTSGQTGFAGLVLVDRLLRPWFWWAWLTLLSTLLVSDKREAWATILLASAWLLVGTVVLVAQRELAWAASDATRQIVILLTVPSAAVLLGLATSWLVSLRRSHPPDSPACARLPTSAASSDADSGR